MREIKFRAWHEGNIYEPTMLYDRKQGDCLRWKNEGQNISAIMQFTGVDDIYEGDIIEHMDSISLKAIVSEVYWNERGYWALRKKNKNFENLLWRAENPRVIGNIYENPELLE